MEEERERWRRLFEENGMPQPSGVLVNVRWRMGSDDWWAKLDDGKWYWYDPREKTWKWSMHGPD